jgi:hypothetical protein
MKKSVFGVFGKFEFSIRLYLLSDGKFESLPMSISFPLLFSSLSAISDKACDEDNEIDDTESHMRQQPWRI